MGSTLEHVGTLHEFAFGAIALHITAAVVESKRQRQSLTGFAALGGFVIQAAASQAGASCDVDLRACCWQGGQHSLASQKRLCCMQTEAPHLEHRNRAASLHVSLGLSPVGTHTVQRAT